MIKKIKIIISNITIFVMLFTIFEAVIYCLDYKNNKLKLKFCWDTGQMHTNYNLKGFFNGRSNRGSSGRKPDGLEYKNKTPILIFGCSFAFGQYLNHKKTVSYKLSKLLKRPVYNRSVPGGGIQHMYYQSISDDLYKETASAPDTVLYIIIGDHFRRMLGVPFTIYDDVRLLHYHKNRNNELIRDNDNFFMNFFKSLYSYKYFRSIAADNYMKDGKNIEKIANQAVEYFVLSKKNLEKNFNKKLKFYVFFYDDCMYYQTFKEKMEDEGFKVFPLFKLANVNYNNNPKYFSSKTNHPKEEAWNLLTPIIAEIINKP